MKAMPFEVAGVTATCRIVGAGSHGREAGARTARTEVGVLARPPRNRTLLVVAAEAPREARPDGAATRRPAPAGSAAADGPGEPGWSPHRTARRSSRREVRGEARPHEVVGDVATSPVARSSARASPDSTRRRCDSGRRVARPSTGRPCPTPRLGRPSTGEVLRERLPRWARADPTQVVRRRSSSPTHHDAHRNGAGGSAQRARAGGRRRRATRRTGRRRGPSSARRAGSRRPAGAAPRSAAARPAAGAPDPPPSPRGRARLLEPVGLGQHAVGRAAPRRRRPARAVRRRRAGRGSRSGCSCPSLEPRDAALEVAAGPQAGRGDDAVRGQLVDGVGRRPRGSRRQRVGQPGGRGLAGDQREHRERHARPDQGVEGPRDAAASTAPWGEPATPMSSAEQVMSTAAAA